MNKMIEKIKNLSTDMLFLILTYIFGTCMLLSTLVLIALNYNIEVWFISVLGLSFTLSTFKYITLKRMEEENDKEIILFANEELVNSYSQILEFITKEQGIDNVVMTSKRMLLKNDDGLDKYFHIANFPNLDRIRKADTEGLILIGPKGEYKDDEYEDMLDRVFETDALTSKTMTPAEERLYVICTKQLLQQKLMKLRPL